MRKIDIIEPLKLLNSISHGNW